MLHFSKFSFTVHSTQQKKISWNKSNNDNVDRLYTQLYTHLMKQQFSRRKEKWKIKLYLFKSSNTNTRHKLLSYQINLVIKHTTIPRKISPFMRMWNEKVKRFSSHVFGKSVECVSAGTTPTDILICRKDR